MTAADKTLQALACCEGKDRMTATRAKEVASRMSSRGKRVAPYKCESCGHYHVGRQMARDQVTRKRLAARKGAET